MNFKRITLGLATAFALLWGGSALAKCTLTVKFKNTDSRTITVLGSKSQVRVNGGLWSKMRFGTLTIKAGKTKSASWTTNMSCGGNAKRDFRIKFESKRNNQTYSDTSKNDIDIYDGQTLTWKLKP